MSKSSKIAPRKKVALELLHHKLVHIYTRSLMDGDTANVWQDIELRIDPDPFSHHVIYLEQIKRLGIKNPLKPKVSIKWVLLIFFQQQNQNV